jgi:hypothetical protein
MNAKISSRDGKAIDITRYAEVTAHLRHFPADKHAEVIARLGIPRRDWDAAAAKWQRVRDAERASGKLEVTVSFGRVLADTRARLAAQQPTLESLGPLPGPDGPPAIAAPIHVTATPAPDKTPGDENIVVTPMVQAPSASLDGPGGDSPSRWGMKTPSYLASALLDEAPSPQAQAAPFAPRAPDPRAIAPPALVTAPPIGEPTSASPLAGTANMDLSAMVAAARREALPFAPSDVPSGVSSPTPAAEAGSGASLAETANMDLSAIVAAVKRGSLPFTPPDQPSPASVAEAPEKARHLAERATGTLQTDYRAVVAAIDQGSLPFVQPDAANPPGAAAGGPDFALLPLETYASLSGALARGEPRADALARHRVSEEVFDRLAKAWAQRFQREPHLLVRFKELARSGAAAPRRDG